MKVLIVCAHMDENSFNAAMLNVAQKTLISAGHEVQTSDLYKMNFDPVCRPGDFTSPKDKGHIKYDIEQRHAVEKGGFTADISSELEKLMWCDQLILQFPFYWFGMPAIMKGWIDRIFVNGVVYGGGKWYDRGGLRGRKAMLAFSTGCYPSMCGPDGINGDMDIILWPIQNGILRFSGMEVLSPHIAFSVAYGEDKDRKQMLVDYADRLRVIENDVPLFFHHRDDFSADWRLKSDIVPKSTGQMLAQGIKRD